MQLEKVAGSKAWKPWSLKSGGGGLEPSSLIEVYAYERKTSGGSGNSHPTICLDLQVNYIIVTEVDIS